MAMYPCLSLPSLSFPTLTGSIVTFNSQYAGLPLKSHTIALTATQSGSGTPSPDNVRTINGYSAINIGHNSTANIFGGIYLLNAFIKANISNFVYDTDNKTLQFGAPNVSSKEMYGVFKPNTQYTFYIVGENSQANRNTNIRILYSDGTTTNIQWSADLANTKQTRVITSTAGKTVVGLKGGNYAGATTLYYDECGAIEGVKTIDDFVAFGGTSYLIQIGSTVYGGEYDARTGVLTVTHGVVDLGTFTNWGYTSSGNRFTSSYVANEIKRPATDSTVADIIADIFDTKSLTNLRSSADDNLIAVGDSGVISVRCTAYGTDANAFKTAMSGHYIVYELATPQTIQLPPCPIDTLEGVNNIWADTGDTTLQYPKFG